MLRIERRFRTWVRDASVAMLLVFSAFELLLWLTGFVEFDHYVVRDIGGGVFISWIYGAVACYLWLLFWEFLGGFLASAAVSERIFRYSAVALCFVWGIALVGASRVSSTGGSAWFRSVIHSRAVGFLLVTGLPTLCMYLFALVCCLFLALVVNYQTPLERELDGPAIWWSARVRHADFVQTARNAGATYIGYEVQAKQAVYLSEDARSRHVHVIGSTGSGKTKWILLPMIEQDLHLGRGVLFIDAKGSAESLSSFREMVRRAGRERDFLHFSLTDPASSARYNPLQNGNASQLKDKIAGSIEWSEPFYQRLCEDALQTIFMHLDRLGRRVTLNELGRLLKTPPPELQTAHPFTPRNRKNIETLTSEINLLTQTPFGYLLDTTTPDINLMDVYKNRRIVYISLDTQSYSQTASRLGKMITQDINALSGLIASEIPPSERRILAVTIDEFQEFGTENFLNTLALGRESGLWITIAHQSLGDLKAVGLAYSQRVLDLTNTKIFTRVNDPETARVFGDVVGKKKVIKSVQQVPLGGKKSDELVANQRVGEEARIHPDEVTRLETGQAVFKSGPRYGRLLLNDPVFASSKTTEASPFSLGEGEARGGTPTSVNGEVPREAGSEAREPKAALPSVDEPAAAAEAIKHESEKAGKKILL